MTKKSSLSPIQSASMADRVEKTLRDYFRDNGLKPGDPLPSEVEIAEQLEVSRNIVREALSRLRMLGIIETRTRRGMIMGNPDILGGFERVLNPNIIDEETLQDIFEMRLILEMGMAEFLFARKTDQDISALEKIVSEQKSIEHPTKEEEIRFHTRLYEMTGNTTFRRFQKMLFPIFTQVFTDYRKNGRPIIAPPNHVHHDGLVKVLKEGTVNDFREAMSIHLSPYFKMAEG